MFQRLCFFFFVIVMKKINVTFHKYHHCEKKKLRLFQKYKTKKKNNLQYLILFGTIKKMFFV